MSAAATIKRMDRRRRTETHNGRGSERTYCAANAGDDAGLEGTGRETVAESTGRIGRRCGTGCTAAMPKARPASLTCRAGCGRDDSISGRWPNLSHGGDRPSRRWIGLHAGGAGTFDGESGIGPAWRCASGPSARARQGSGISDSPRARPVPGQAVRDAVSGVRHDGAPIGPMPMADARIGQQGKLTQVRAEQGTRSQRACLFGGRLPGRDAAAGPIMFFADIASIVDDCLDGWNHLKGEPRIAAREWA